MEQSSLSPSPNRTGTTRVLFVSLWELGWKTWASQMEKYSENFPGLEAVHLRVTRPRWVWALAKEWPRPIGRALVSSKRSWEWIMKREVIPAIASGKFDVVFVSSQIMAPTLIEPCRRAGARLAVAMDVTGPAYQRDLLGREVPPSQTWDDERRIYDATDLYVPMSSWIADSLEHDFGVPVEQICVTPPSVTIPSTVPSSSQPKSELPRILFCGNDWERKGGPRLVRWHQELWSQKAELHIVSGNVSASELALPGVFHHGFISYERLTGEMLPSSDIFCLPTRNDMSPFAVSEAQANSLPTVSSRIGGLSDLVLEGETGFLLPPEDEDGFKEAITRLIDDPALRATMREAARAHADEHLDVAKVLPRLFERLIALKAEI